MVLGKLKWFIDCASSLQTAINTTQNLRSWICSPVPLRMLCSLFVILHNWDPGLIRVEALHLLEFVKSARSEVLLIDDTVLTNDEGLDTRLTVLGWGGYQGEASDHHAFHDVVHLTQRGRWTLPFQNLEEISVVWLGSGGVTLFDHPGDLFANWSTPTAILVLPAQAILFAGVADNALGVLVYVEAFAWLERILVLRVHIPSTDIDCVQLVSANAAMEEFLPAGSGIEVPLVPRLHERHRKRPVLVAHEQESPVPLLWVHANVFLFASFCSEISSSLTVLRVFTRENNVVAIRSEDFFKSVHVKLLGRFDKFIGSLLRSVEHLC